MINHVDVVIFELLGELFGFAAAFGVERYVLGAADAVLGAAFGVQGGGAVTNEPEGLHPRYCLAIPILEAISLRGEFPLDELFWPIPGNFLCTLARTRAFSLGEPCCDT